MAIATPTNATSSTTPATPGPAAPCPKPGDRAPDFALPSDDGPTIRLSDLRGRFVVVYFYPRDLTPGCTTEACDFRDREPAFSAANAVILGISGDTVQTHARFRSKHNLGFPLLADVDHTVARAYGAFGTKKLYGRTSEGILRSTFVIDPAGIITAVWQPVKVKDHAQAVLDQIPSPKNPA